MIESPFQYGTLATKENFVDRINERASLKQMLFSGINVSLISPRRWGKSSLVRMAMDELVEERKDVRVCYLDAFSINTVEDFYSKFATAVVSCTSNKIEKVWSDAKRYIGGIIPGFTVSDGLNDILTVNFRHDPLKGNQAQILDLPERIASDKGIRIIVCIDEFQQLAEMDGYSELEGKMRSVWQYHKHVSYCFYGSKKHMMMEIFNDSQKPFYRFSETMFLGKIAKHDWVPFIVTGFQKTGKTISEAFASQICDFTDCHSWYLQQLSYFVWSDTKLEVTEEIMKRACRRIVDTNAPMFVSDVEKLTSSQREMLKAITAGETHLSSSGARERFQLGNLTTITRNKKVLETKSFIDSNDGLLEVSDPIFQVWFREKYSLGR
ncbi:MAG: ATP-binding protein [Bacteroidales bacterium]|nr:ATP-binding protein [Bacteroidales bacterium]